MRWGTWVSAAVALVCPLFCTGFPVSLATSVCGQGRQAPRMAAALHEQDGTTRSESLLVVGAGTLGSLVAKLWKEQHASAEVVAETFTTSRHEALRKSRIRPTTREAREEALEGARFSHVVFAVPPSKEADYAEELRKALKLWDRGGNFLFTSSGGVFAEDNGGRVHELSEVSPSPRTQKILDAEKATLEGGGVVLRLAGLYTPDRGPHTFWLARGEVGAPEEGIINLLHYEDAARATIACLKHVKPDTNQRVLIAADDTPITRRQICEAAVSSPYFKGKHKMPVFKVEEAAPKSLGKVYDTTLSRALMGGWNPLYPSFVTFMAQQSTEQVGTR